MRALLAVGGVGLGLFVVVFATRTFGRVHGTEFSPDTFASREFVYYELPLIRYPITKVYRDSTSGILQNKLTNDSNLLPAASADSPRWDLVRMKKGKAYYEDDALIVFRYLDENGEASERWRTWSNDHGPLAKILWPAVAEACRRDLYTFTPELFMVAEQLTVPEGATPSVDDFKKAIAQAMARQYTALADVRREEGQLDEAIELYSAALEHVEHDRTALAGRAKAYDADGENAKAQRDRQRLRDLPPAN